jgi:hypothetical protein
MNSVFVFARLYLRIDSDWAFATGAPSGLVKDAWNIRLVLHYGLAAFFVLSHLAAGGRTHPRPKHDHDDVAFRWLGQTERNSLLECHGGQHGRAGTRLVPRDGFQLYDAVKLTDVLQIIEHLPRQSTFLDDISG